MKDPISLIFRLQTNAFDVNRRTRNSSVNARYHHCPVCPQLGRTGSGIVTQSPDVCARFPQEVFSVVWAIRTAARPLDRPALRDAREYSMPQPRRTLAE